MRFASGPVWGDGPITKKLYDTLTGIQMGRIKVRKVGFADLLIVYWIEVFGGLLSIQIGGPSFLSVRPGCVSRAGDLPGYIVFGKQVQRSDELNANFD